MNQPGLSKQPQADENPSILRFCLVWALIVTLSLVVFVGWAGYTHLKIFRSPQGPRYTCQNNLKHLGLGVNMWANEEKEGRFPELSNRAGELAMRDEGQSIAIYPEYLFQLEVLRCPASEKSFGCFTTPKKTAPLSTVADDRSYFYLGYYIPDQESLEHFAMAYRAQLESGGDFSKDLAVPGLATAILRLRHGAIPDAPNAGSSGSAAGYSQTPLFIERYPNGHALDGGGVAYLDGHVEWIKFGTKWPMTQEAMDVLMALDALGEPPHD